MNLLKILLSEVVYNAIFFGYRCPMCNYPLSEKKENYCPNCGQPIKWNIKNNKKKK